MNYPKSLRTDSTTSATLQNNHSGIRKFMTSFSTVKEYTPTGIFIKRPSTDTIAWGASITSIRCVR